MTKIRDPGTPTTRERLLVAAAELIAELGWTAVTSRAVADRAGVNNGVVHYHFGSMEALRRAATLHATDRLLHDAVEWFIAAPSTLGSYSALLSAAAALDASEAPTAVLLEAMLHAPRDDETRAMVAGMITPFREVLEDKLRADVAAGRVRGDLDVHGTAIVLAALFDGLMLHAMVDPGIAVERAIGVVDRLLTPPGQRARA